MIIEKKVWPEYFENILDGTKNYELRLADWTCKKGDILLLKEWDPQKKLYTGREIKKEISYVSKFKVQDLFWPKEDIEKYGIQVISFK